VLLADLLDARRVKVPLISRSKDEVLRELVELAAADLGPATASAILSAVRDREQLLSTGIGWGVAIPHGTTPHVDHIIMAAGVAPDPIDFDALDGKPVELFFLLIGPESAAGAHVKALSRISRLLRREGLRRDLRAAASNTAFLEIIRTSDPK
jgi:mannitol/fructose-specific phosphotransferase system IIA component (Ntr-type)